MLQTPGENCRTETAYINAFVVENIKIKIFYCLKHFDFVFGFFYKTSPAILSGCVCGVVVLRVVEGLGYSVQKSHEDCVANTRLRTSSKIFMFWYIMMTPYVCICSASLRSSYTDFIQKTKTKQNKNKYFHNLANKQEKRLASVRFEPHHVKGLWKWDPSFIFTPPPFQHTIIGLGPSYNMHEGRGQPHSPGEQEFHFPHFFLKFRSIFHLKLFSFCSTFWPSWLRHW